MEQNEYKHEDSNPVRENLRRDFARLVEEYRGYLHQKDIEDIQSAVADENFDVRSAETLLRTLPESLRKAKELYEKFGGNIRGKTLIPYILNQKYKFERMTFQEKTEAMKRLQEETEMAKIVLSKLEEYRTAELISEVQVDYKLRQFLDLPFEQKKVVLKNLTHVLRFDERQKELERFRSFPKKAQEEYGDKFKTATLEKRKKMNDWIEQSIRKLKSAYGAKIEDFQKPDPQANFLSLFSTVPASVKGSSADLYMRWFSQLSIREMRAFLKCSDLDKPERKLLRDRFASILNNLPEKERGRLRKEFNESDSTKRKDLIAKYQKKKPETPEGENNAAITSSLKEELSSNSMLAAKIETLGIMQEFAKRRRRAELTLNARSTEALQEKSREKGKVLKLKRENLENRRDLRTSLKRYLKPDIKKPDAVETNVNLLNQAGREVHSEEFSRTEVSAIEKDIQKDIKEQFPKEIDLEEIAKDRIKKAA